MDYGEAELMSRCPSWSNSLWQGWSCGLVHCPGGNATDPIWRVQASSDGISSWTPLKTQHSIPCWLLFQREPNSDVLTFYSFLTSLHPSQTPWHPWISYATQKLMLDSCKMLQNMKHSIRYCGIFSKNFITYRSSKVSSRSDCIFEIH